MTHQRFATGDDHKHLMGITTTRHTVEHTQEIVLWHIPGAGECLSRAHAGNRPLAYPECRRVSYNRCHNGGNADYSAKYTPRTVAAEDDPAACSVRVFAKVPRRFSFSGIMVSPSYQWVIHLRVSGLSLPHLLWHQQTKRHCRPPSLWLSLPLQPPDSCEEQDRSKP